MAIPKVSVIIPVYNVELYLDECVASVMQSSLREIEILLIDDGSTDNSLTLCRKWEAKDSRIRVYHKRNGGLSDARNYGLARAKGEFIAFVDSDDKIDSRMLEDMYNACQQYDCKISICGVMLWRPGDETNSEEYVEDLPTTEETSVVDMNYTDYTGMYHNTAWRKLYHYSLFLSDAKFPYGLYHEDVGFWWIMMAQIDRLTVINKPLYYYRQNNTKSICNVLNRHRRANDTILSFAYGLKHGRELVPSRREHAYLSAFLRTYLKTSYSDDISRRAMLIHRGVMEKLCLVAQNSDGGTREMFFSKLWYIQDDTMLKIRLFRELRWLEFGLSLSMFGVNILKLQFGRNGSPFHGG